MKILMVNSFHYLRGGAERCFLELSALLRDRGHEVIPFCMDHEKNLPSPYASYFISKVDYPSLMASDASPWTKVKTIGRTFYSLEAQRNLDRLISDVQPAIAHIHGIAHEMSPSILPVLKRHGIPVVQTLHDYKLLCPNTSFLSQGEVCEACKGHHYFNVVRKRCKRGSLAASLVAGAEMVMHKVMQIYEKNVDAFIAPSKFLQHKLHEYGVKNRVVQIPNFINPLDFPPVYEKEDAFVFLGRLVEVKGVDTLLAAMRLVKRSHLHVIGDGEREAALKTYAQEHGIPNVTFHGHLSKEQLTPLVQRARFTLAPSTWYENYPMSILESFACGTPVIGSNIGGIAELVQDQKTGLLFEAGNASQLAQTINHALDHPAKMAEMGRAARQQVERENDPESHYRQTMIVYESLMS
jgi:glycosyltransferase involved in cell wall biosynthesis